MRVSVNHLTFERAGIIPVKIVEVTQSSDRDNVKVIAARGLGECEMVRTQTVISEKSLKIPAFNTGQVIPILVAGSNYHGSTITVLSVLLTARTAYV